jgi:hypothetical protein
MTLNVSHGVQSTVVTNFEQHVGQTQEIFLKAILSRS